MQNLSDTDIDIEPAELVGEAVEAPVAAAPDVAAMTALYADAFDRENIGPDDDFFELGGDSLLAETLMTAIEGRFGIGLSVSLLLEAPTPARLTAAVAEALERRHARCLVPVRPDGPGLPLYCVHGLNGASIFPRRLAAEMPGRPIFALRAIGLQTGETPHDTVETIAEAYVREIREHQPTGPYLLFGQCATAIIALEMAVQLRAAGEEAARLILADPAIDRIAAPWLKNSGLALKLIQTRIGQRAMLTALAMSDDEEFSAERRGYVIQDLLRDVVGAYSIKPYGGPTLLICSRVRREALLDTAQGMPRFFSDLRIANIGETHKSVFTEHRTETAAAIRAFLDGADPASA